MHLALTRAGHRLRADTGLSLARPLGPLLTPCKAASWPMAQREKTETASDSWQMDPFGLLFNPIPDKEAQSGLA